MRHLREILRKKGWRSHSDRGVELVVHPVTGIAVAICSAAGVGREWLTPRSKRPKGPITKERILANNRSFLPFDGDEIAAVAPTPDADTRVTWLLLNEVVPSARDDEEDTVWAEISLPRGHDEAGYITSWQRRILLGSVGLGSESAGHDDGEADDLDDGLEIPVSLR